MTLEHWLLATQSGVSPPPPSQLGLYGIGTLNANLGHNDASPSLNGVSSWSQISTGFSHTIAIRSDGTLWGWGSNNVGQLGRYQILDENRRETSPVLISSSSWSQISAGSFHSLAIRSDGTLWGWGLNTSRQVITDQYLNVFSPVQISSQSWKFIASGLTHNAAIRNDDTLWVWGTGTSGQLAQSDYISRSSITQVGSDTWKAVACGTDFTIAIKSDNSLWSWGNNNTGQLGLNNRLLLNGTQDSWIQTATTEISALAIKPNGTLWGWGSNLNSNLGGVGGAVPAQPISGSWIQVGAFFQSSHAIRSDGMLFGWGLNTSGQIGTGSAAASGPGAVIGTPTQIGNSSWTFISNGYTHTLAIRSDGALFAWGGGGNGELGIGTQINISSPVQVGTDSWTQVSAGFSYSMGIKSDGSLWGWGNNDGANSRLGLSNIYILDTPQYSWNQLSAGTSHTIGIRSDGSLWAWGLGTSGELGTGLRFNYSSPVQIGTSSWIQVAAGLNHNLGITADGGLWVWGLNTNGELGLSSVAIVTNTDSWTTVSSGFGHTLGIKSNGTLWGWGLNTSGQLGISSGINQSSPVQIGTDSWLQVSSGNTHSIAIRTDNSIWSWGLNTSGQLGDNTIITKSSPVQISTGSWTQVKAGSIHTSAIRSDGSLFTWGWNTSGQLGDNTTISRSSPVQIGSSSWTQVSIGDSHTVAIRSDGSLFTWGWNTSGQLGDNTTVNRSSPVQIGSSSWTFISAGSSHTVAIRSDSALFTWGLNSSGQLGIQTGTNVNTTIDSKSSPVQVGTSSWTQISAGLNHTVAIRSDGGLFAWGDNTVSKLGNGDAVARSSPIQIGTSSWSQIAAGASHTSAIRSDGAVFGWGLNSSGQLGLSSTTNQTSPIPLGLFGNIAIAPTKIGNESWTQVIAGQNHSLAVRSDNSLWAWGLGTSGQTGDGTTISRSSPVQVTTNNFNISWSQISAGAIHTLGVATNGGLYVWGTNTDGRLGILAPRIESDIFSWTQVSQGENHTVAIRSDGLLFSWGLNTSGQMGDGTAVSKQSPVQIGSNSWTQIAVGQYHTLAIRNDGALFTWGAGADGVIGDGFVRNISSPVQIGSDSWTQVAAGYSHSLAIRSDGSLWSWGRGSEGQLGLGLFNVLTSRSSPVQVAGGLSWNQIAAGQFHSLAINSIGHLYGWGSNGNGVLGKNASLVGNDLESWSQITTGENHTVAIKSNGTLWSWGYNNVGQLGNQNVITQSSPVQIGTSSWTQVVTEFNHTLAIRSDGALFTWGDNTNGKLGDGTVANKSSPVQIGSDSWTQIAVGQDHSLAIRSDGTLWAWGIGTDGRLGIDSFPLINRSSPTQVTAGGLSWNQINAGQIHSLGIDSTGSLYTWGSNVNGILGIPSTVIGNDIGSWSQVVTTGSSSQGYTLAIRSNGTLWAWGSGSNGKLGDNTVVNKSSPVQIGTNSWTMVRSKSLNALAIRSDGLLFAWGVNDNGQLGLNDRINRSSPVQIGTDSWSQISVGVNNGFAIRSDGLLFAWGLNDNGQLGTNDRVNRSSPVQIGSDSWSQIAGASNFTAAIRSDGTLWTWGGNNFGQLGLSDNINRSSPVQIGSDSWTQITTGNGAQTWSGGYTVAIRSDGLLFAWGSNSRGQLGDNTIINKSSPVQVGTNSWSQVSAGDNHTLAVRSDGLLFSWGHNGGQDGPNQTLLVLGRLGTNDGANRSSPTQIGTDSWSQVSASFEHSAAIRSDGVLFMWGFLSNDFKYANGAIASPAVNSLSSPVQIGVYGNFAFIPQKIGTSSWSQVAAGQSHSLALRSDGGLFAWGLNTSSQIGDGTAVSKSSPVQIGTSSWTQVKAGYNFSLAIRSDGRLFTWGLGTSGQLGDGTSVTKNSPVQIGTDSWTQMSGGSIHGFAIRSDGSLYGWGDSRVPPGSGPPVKFAGNQSSNSPIQLSSFGNYAYTPNKINESSWTQVAAGQSYSFAIRSDGALFAWGQNNVGQLGINTIINRSSPVQVGTDSWTQIKAGFSHTAAIRTDGGLFTWGLGSSGQIGNLTLINRSAPVQIGTDSWTQVAAHGATTFAIRNNGQLRGFGNNNNGQLALLSTANQSSPVQIGSFINFTPNPLKLGSDSWTQVAAGSVHSLAIRSDGGLFAWGLGTTGELGIGLAASRSSPVQIGTDSWSQIAAGVNNNIAVRSDGLLFTWGLGTSGQLGNNTATNRSSPVQIGSASWTKVSAKNTFVNAIQNDGSIWSWGLNNAGQTGTRVVQSLSSPAQIGSGLAVRFPVKIGNQSWSQVSAKVSHTLAIRSNGTLWAWGRNNEGQLGQNDLINRSSPTQVGSDSDWANVHTGYSYSVARKTSKQLWGWGLNTSGQLGLLDLISRSTPVQIASDRSWDAVSTASDFTLLISDDKNIYGFGTDTNSKLGIGDGATYNSPIIALASKPSSIIPRLIDSNSWIQISAGNSHGVGLKADQTLYTWGLNDNGQLGSNDRINRSSPTQIGTDSWTQVSAKQSFTAAIRTDSGLFTWGVGTSGQIGNGASLSRSAPTQVGTSSWSQVSASGGHTEAILTNNLLYSWGLNDNGQLGINSVTNQNSPVLVGLSFFTLVPVTIDSAYSWTQVSAGGETNSTYYTAIRADGLLFAWGFANSGRIGDGLNINRSSPVQIGTDSWAFVNSGRYHTVAIRSDGALFAWGLNDGGQLGISLTANRSSPVQIGTDSWVMAATAQRTTAAIKLDGTLWGWGQNDVGQIPGVTGNRSSPVLISSDSWKLIAGSAFDKHFLAIKGDNTLWSWGLNTSGQLGDGTLITKSSPVQVSVSSWTQVAAGSAHSLAIRSDGSLWAWGSNPSYSFIIPSVPTMVSTDQNVFNTVNNSSLGYSFRNYGFISSDGKIYLSGYNGGHTFGDYTDSLLFARDIWEMPWGNSWSQISVGTEHIMAIKNDGTLWGWGYNVDGAVTGEADVDEPGFSWTQIGVGINHGFALRSDGKLYAWGRNDFGQLGNNRVLPYTSYSGNFSFGMYGTTSGSNYSPDRGPVSSGYLTLEKPTPITSDSWNQISVNQSHILAIKSDGTLWSWGVGSSGQLGNLSTVTRSSPVQVDSGSWLKVSAGLNNSFAIKSDYTLWGWGSNSFGKLGIATPTFSWTKVSTNAGGTILAIRSDGLLFAWGNNNAGQLGDISIINKSSPVQIGNSSWTQVEVGHSHSFAIRSDNTLWGWGLNNFGQVGNGTGIEFRSSPVQVGAGISWTQISAGLSHTLGIASDGALYAWGANFIGQAGFSVLNRDFGITEISEASWTQISSSIDFSVGITSLGKMYTWGLGTSGQLGVGLPLLSRKFPSLVPTTQSWTQVSAGSNHVLAITTAGELFSFGLNSSGELGLNDRTDRNSPIQVSTTSSWTMVSAGNAASAAIDVTGRLFTWGANTNGKLGHNTVINRSSPVQVGTDSWTMVSSSLEGNHTSAIRLDGGLFTWGLATDGRLGNNDQITRSAPIQIGSSSWTQVKSGLNHTLAIRSDGALFAWGLGTSGQLGAGDLITRSSPVQVAGSFSWSQISAGSNFSLGISNTNIMFVWGTNANGGLGLPTTTVGTNIQSWSQISAGEFHTLAIRSDGGLFAWGIGTSGQIGDNTAANKSSPVQIGTSSWTQIATGLNHSLAIRLDGGLFAWGLGAAGQLGIDVTTNRSSPVQIGTSSWTQIAAGLSHSLAIRTDNALFAWGIGTSGQLGTGNLLSRSSPVQITVSQSWAQLAAGESHSLALTSNGGLFAWGSNIFGQLGLPTTFIPTNITSWAQISAGDTHAVGITSTGALFAWGLGTSGQLGDNSAVTKSSPVQIGTSSWTQAVAGALHSLAIRVDGALFSWGAGADGRLGLNANINRSSPVQIGTDSWIQVSTNGGSHTLAVRLGGGLFAWGLNNAGQLGDGTVIARSSPVQLGTNSWAQVSTGTSHSIAKASDGTLFGWGLNNVGQIGNNSILNRSSPVQISTDSWAQISSGHSHNFALTASGVLWSWGLNNFGQLGDENGIEFRSSPVQVSTSLSWSNVSAGPSYTVGVTTAGVLYGWGTNAQNQLGVPLSDGDMLGSTQVREGSWAQVSSSLNFSAGITTDGSLYVWGQNNNGQLGNNSTVSRRFPIRIATDNSWSQVSTGANHTLIVDTLGRLYSFGLNSSGELGDGTIIARSSPVQVGTSSWTLISAGAAMSAAIDTTGRLFTWGAGSDGRLGTNAVLSRSSPVQIGTPSSWTTVSSSKESNFSAAIRSDGALFTFGLGSSGQMGDGFAANRSSPIQVGTSSWSQVKAGAGHVLALRFDGLLFSWGLGTSGQLGDGTLTSKSSPVQVNTNVYSGSWSQLSAGNATSMGITPTGALYIWGTNLNGGLGTFNDQMRNDYFSWSQIENGTNHSLAIRSDGLLFAWGLGTSGQLGDNTAISKSSPVQIGTSNSWTQIKVGDTSSYALRQDGAIFAWGNNFTGQLGDNTLINKSSPIQIGSSSWTLIDSGFGHVAAITIDGALFTWGLNNLRQLGTGTLDTFRSSPTQVGLSSWSQVTAGGFFTAGITSTGELFAWGESTSGQLSQSAFKNYPISEYSWTQVSTRGPGTTLAIRSDGTLWSWGLNDDGQLGDNTIISKSSPVQISSDSWIKVHAGYKCSFAIRSDFTLWTWGGNINGRLGINDTINRSSPVQIGTESWVQVASSGDEDSMAALAIKTTNGIDGTLWSWGTNLNGILGINDGGFIRRSSPVQIGTDTSWNLVALGGNGSTAAASRTQTFSSTVNYLYTWGLNNIGQLGINDIVSRSSPVLVSQIPARNFYQAHNNLFSITYLNLVYINNNFEVWGAGQAVNGILGTGTSVNVNRSQPVQIQNTNAGYWAEVACHGVLAWGRRININPGTLWGWGSDSPSLYGGGSLGINSSGLIRSSPVLIGTSSWTQISALPGFSTDAPAVAAIRSDGRLFLWGRNSSGQFGDYGQPLDRSSPVQIGTFNFIDELTRIGTDLWTGSKLSAGSNHIAAIKNTGSLFTWGLNSNGQLGINDTSNRSSPVQIGTSSWTQVSAGGAHTSALRIDGALFTWGLNSSGQLGDNTVAQKNSPVQIGISSWSQIASGGTYTGGILNDGTLWTWGSSASGQTGSSLTNRSSPVLVGTINKGVAQPFLNDSGSWTQVASGQSHTLGIKTDSKLFVWGQNDTSELGSFDTINRSSPVQIGTGINTLTPRLLNTTSSWVQASAGLNYSLAIRQDGNLWGWGLGTSGQIANPNATYSSPVQTGIIGNFTFNPNQIGLSSWTQIAAGQSHSAAIRTDRALFTWGGNASGQLGINDIIPRSSPVQIGTSSWTQVSAELNHNIAITNDGAIFTWGLNSSGQLGINNTINRSSPIQVGTSSWTLVRAGGAHSTAIRTDGSLWVWGSNTNGALSAWVVANLSSPVQLGAFGNYTFNPYRIDTDSWTQVAAGQSHSMAIKSDNKIYVWGQNNLSELGTFDTINRSSPVQLGTGFVFLSPTKLDNNSWTQVEAGQDLSVAIKSDSTLWAWGLNSSGQVGDNTTITKSSPVQIGTSSWSQISVTASHVAAIRTDGTLWTWGNNGTGQLGNNTIINRSSPVAISSTKSNWSRVFTTTNGTAAIDSANTVWGWGANDVNQLFTITNVNRSAPVQVLPDRTYNDFAMGVGNFYGVNATTNLLNIWGRNTTGQLGLNFTETDATVLANMSLRSLVGILENFDRSSPIQIGTSSWTQVSAGYSSTLALTADNKLFNFGPTNIIQPKVTHSWSKVAATPWVTTAIKTDGTLWTWGLINSGVVAGTLLLGDGTAISRSSPVQISTASWKQIEADYSYIVAIDSNDKLHAWGNSTTGIFGIYGSNSNGFRTPVLIDLDNSWKQVSATSDSILAIRSDDTLWGWGSNSSGKLGLNDIINRSSPVQIGTSSWSQVSVGHQTAAGITIDGKLFTWGSVTSTSGGAAPALGDGTTIARSSPVQVGTSSWTQVSVGQRNGLLVALRQDNTLWFSGGQVGNSGRSTEVTPTSSMTQVGVANNWTKVLAGGTGFAVLNNLNELYYHSTNDISGATSGDFPFFNGLPGATTSPVRIGTNLTITDFNLKAWPNYVAFSTGIINSWGSLGFILSDGSLFITPQASGGQIGNNSNADPGDPFVIVDQRRKAADAIPYTTLSSPVQIGTDSSWIFVSSGEGASFAIRGDNALFTWGNNTNGRLGIGNVINRSSPVQIGTDSWKFVNSAGAITYGVTTANTLFTWGSGYHGDNTTTARSSPVQVTSYSWKELHTSAGNLSAGLTSNGHLYITGISNPGGTNEVSLLGDATPAIFNTIRRDRLYFTRIGSRVSILSPVQIGTDSWTMVAAARNTTFGIKNDGTLWAWGSNNGGQIGNGITIPYGAVTPLTKIGNQSWSFVSSKGDWCAAVRSDGTAWFWGQVPATTDYSSGFRGLSSPVQIGTSTNWEKILAGQTRDTVSGGIKTDGSLIYPVGYYRMNTQSALEGSSLGDVNWKSITGVVNTTWAIDENNTLYYISSSTPFALNRNIISYSSDIFGYGISTDNQLFRAGDNVNLNTNTTAVLRRYLPVTLASNPVQIGSQSWNFVGSGASYGYGIQNNNYNYAFGSTFFGNYSQPVQITSETFGSLASSVDNMILKK